MKRMLPLLALFLAAAAGNAKEPVASSVPTQQFNCDTLAIEQQLDRATLRDLGPAHSLDAAAAVLTRHGVRFQRTHQVLTVDGTATKLLHDLNTLPSGEPIILPNGQGSAICVLRPSADSI